MWFSESHKHAGNATYSPASEQHKAGRSTGSRPSGRRMLSGRPLMQTHAPSRVSFIQAETYSPRTVSYEVRSRIRCGFTPVPTEQVDQSRCQSHSAVARLQFQRETTIRIRVCLLELNETYGSGLASHTPVYLQSTEGSRIASQSVHRLLNLGHVPDGSYTGPEVSCDSCCFFCDWYTTCSSSNLPSSEYAGQDCRGESPLVEWSCDTVHFSLIDPKR